MSREVLGSRRISAESGLSKGLLEARPLLFRV